MEAKNIYIEFRYNSRELVGVDEFVSEVKEDYIVQAKPKWVPAFSEGGEVWLDIIINSPFFEFAKDIIIDSAKELITDPVKELMKEGVKYYLLKPLFQAIKKLAKSNEGKWELKVEKLHIKFDDIDIIIGGVNKKDELTAVVAVFNEVAKRVKKIECQANMKICRIETPVKYNSNRYDLDEGGCEDIAGYVKMWKIVLGYGVEERIYSLQEERFLGDYE